MLLYRWTEAVNAASALETDILRRSWRHYMPKHCGMTSGTCFSDDPTWWHRDGADSCLVLDSYDIPADQTVRLNAQTVWTLTQQWQSSRNGAERAEIADKIRRHLEAAANDQSTDGPESPDEWFIVGDIRNFTDRIHAIVHLGPAPVGLRTACRTSGVPLVIAEPSAIADPEAWEEMVAWKLEDHVLPKRVLRTHR